MDQIKTESIQVDERRKIQQRERVELFAEAFQLLFTIAFYCIPVQNTRINKVLVSISFLVSYQFPFVKREEHNENSKLVYEEILKYMTEVSIAGKTSLYQDSYNKLMSVSSSEEQNKFIEERSNFEELLKLKRLLMFCFKYVEKTLLSSYDDFYPICPLVKEELKKIKFNIN